jgi:integrase/recombinase XerD
MAWRRFLGFLAIEEPPALDIAPTERVTTARVREFATHLAATNLPQSVAAQVDMLYKAVRIMMPERDWTGLKTIKARLYAVAPVHGAPKPVITSLRLLDLGQQLMDESQPQPGAPIRLSDAVRYRDGLMIALLAFMPLRRKNLASLEIDRHLVRKGDAWFIILPGSETKTGSAGEFVVPDLLVSNFVAYLDVIRPRMLQHPNCRALWVSRKGRALDYSAIGNIIGRYSSDRFGFHIAPHDVRDAAATTWAIAMPAQIDVARDLLTHVHIRTTQKHYIRRVGIEASRAYAKRIGKIRARR